MPTLKTRTLPTGRCLICGDDLNAPVFECPCCATPHHSACWQWTGGCAVYACAQRPRPMLQARQRDEELARVAAVAERSRVQPPRPVQPARPLQGHEPSPAGTVRGPLATTIMYSVFMMCLVVVGAQLDASRRASRLPRAVSNPGVSRLVRRPVWTPAPRVMNVLSPEERFAEMVLRDDDLWDGPGTMPATGLRRMMVAEAGEALRSGVRQLARRDLPSWVRARLQALEGVESEPVLQLLALRRP